MRRRSQTRNLIVIIISAVMFIFSVIISFHDHQMNTVVFAQILTYVGPGAYGVALSLSLLVGVVLGGRGSLVGAVIGAVLLVGLPVAVSNLAGERGWSDQITNSLPTFLYGLLLVLVVLIAPGGVMGLVGSGWRRVTGRFTTRR
jgi:branched-chain amino acid transport system permease protein